MWDRVEFSKNLRAPLFIKDLSNDIMHSQIHLGGLLL